MIAKQIFLPVITNGYAKSIKMLDFSIKMLNIIANNTSHAFRKICAPWGVTFFGRLYHAV